MTKHNLKMVQGYAELVKMISERLNDIRVRLEGIAGNAFLDASTCGQALSEEVRLFDGGNNRLAEAVHVALEALAFYGELLGIDFDFGEEEKAGEDDRRAALRKNSPTGGEETTSPRPAVRRQRGEGEQKKARCETCKFCAFPRTSDDNGGACKCKLLRRKTIDVLVIGGSAPAWCPLNERAGVKA